MCQFKGAYLNLDISPVSRASFTQDVKCSVAGEFPFLRGSVLHFQSSVRVEDEVKILDRKPTYLCVDEIGTTCPCTWMRSCACTCCYRIRRSELKKRRNMWCIATGLDWEGFICLYISEKIQKFERKSKCTGQCENVEDTRNEGNISQESFPL